MSRAAQLSTALAALVLAASTLAGCTASGAPEVAEPTDTSSSAAGSEVAPSTPAAPPTPATAEAATCDRISEVVSYTEGLYLLREGTLVDSGARPFAEGEVTLDAEGTPVTYTVAPGDVEAVIAERLCAYPNLGVLNHVRAISPNQVLWLTPDPDTPSLGMYSPPTSETGFLQIPYQDAMSAARQAVDAGDIETVQSIWNNTLRGMITDSEVIDAVQHAVDSADPEALRQLFS
jgi:hypothetical protein